MASRVIFWLCAGLSLAYLTPARAAIPDVPAPGSAAVIYLSDDSGASGSRAALISDTAEQARRSLSMHVENYVLSDEKELPRLVERIAGGDAGLIVIIDPHDIDTLSTLPGLYPDIRFSIVGVNAPLYFTNVHSVVFRSNEGLFIAGALAALHSPNHQIAFASRDDNALARNFAYAFSQGAKYVTPDINMERRMDNSGILRDNTADVTLVLDDTLLDKNLREAKAHKRLIIAASRDVTDAWPGTVLTSLVWHEERTLYAELKSYGTSRWKAGNRSVGLSEGAIDYVLDDSNKALMTKQTVDQVERIRDLISEGIIKVDPLP